MTQLHERDVQGQAMEGASLDTSRIQELGVLDDGRSVLRLQGRDSGTYGFYLAEPGATIIPVDTQEVVPAINSLLTSVNAAPIQSDPDLFVVMPSGEETGKPPRFLVLDVTSANERTYLAPFRGTPPEGIDMSGGVELENGIRITSAPGRREVIVQDGIAYSSHYRKVAAYDDQRFATHLSADFADRKKIPAKWQHMYAKEAQRIVAAQLPPVVRDRAYTLIGMNRADILRASSATLEELQEAVLSRQPQSYWAGQYQHVLEGNALSQIRPDDFPPHLQITTAEQARTYYSLSIVMKEQAEVYTQLAKRAKLRTNGHHPVEEIHVTHEDLLHAEMYTTELELRQYFEELAWEHAEATRIRDQYARDVAHFITVTGLPHEWVGNGDYAKIQGSAPLPGTPEYGTSLPIEPHVPAAERKASMGMFARAVERSIPETPEWAGVVHSPKTRDEIVEAMRARANTPLFEVTSPEDTSAEGLARHIWTTILTSPRVEALGNNVREKTAEDEIVAKMAAKIDEGKPIDILIFGPWGTAQSPLRSGGRQTPHLGHLDFLGRFTRLETTIRQLYVPSEDQPAVKFHWVNESSAFAGLIDTRRRAEIDAFQEDMMRMHAGLSERQIFQLYAMGDLMTGTPEKQAIFQEFQGNYSAHIRALFDAYDNHELKDAAQIAFVQEKRQLIYPIATIIDPYQFIDPATPRAKVAVAYELMRAHLYGKNASFFARYGDRVDAEVKAVAETLFGTARELVLTHYMPIMDSRYDTRKFVRPETAGVYDTLDPWTDLYKGKVHGRITDGGKNRWWPNINSGNSLTHPTHGVAIIRPHLEERAPDFSMRTWAEVAAEPDRYAPVYLKGDEEGIPFHYIQVK